MLITEKYCRKYCTESCAQFYSAKCLFASKWPIEQWCYASYEKVIPSSGIAVSISILKTQPEFSSSLRRSIIPHYNATSNFFFPWCSYLWGTKWEIPLSNCMDTSHRKSLLYCCISQEFRYITFHCPILQFMGHSLIVYIFSVLSAFAKRTPHGYHWISIFCKILNNGNNLRKNSKNLVGFWHLLPH